jgi:hypothetical protein
MKTYLLLFSLLLGTYCVSASSLNGTYTIDKSGSGTKNFKSFRLAVSALNTKGVSGPVVFNVASGTYRESFEIDSFAGSSATNIVTFQSKVLDSSKVIIDTSWSGYNHTECTIRLNGAGYVSFYKICVKNIITSSNEYGDVIQITGKSHHISISHTRLLSNTGTSIRNYGAVINNDWHYNDNFLTIANNYISGAQYNIMMSGCGVGSEVGNSITGNIMQYAYTGIYVYLTGGINIEGNKMNYYTYGVYGIYIDNFNSFSDTINISNNFVSLPSGGGYGLYSYSNNVMNIYNNSIAVNGLETAIIIYGYSKSCKVNLVNNLISNYGKGLVINSSALFHSDYNNFFTFGNKLGIYNGASISNLNTWMFTTSLDSNSLSEYPYFVDATKGDLHLSSKSKRVAYSGAVISAITNDIDLEPRKNLYSIGADQVGRLKNDAGIVSIDSNLKYICGAAAKNIKVSVLNFGLDTLKNVTVKWNVNGIARKDIKWKGVLLPGVKISIPLDTVSFIMGKFTKIVAWTDSPDSMQDNNTANDSNTISISPGMSGSYTIGGSSADFLSFRSAVAFMSTTGVCGAVTFNVRDGIYKESVEINNITGSSKTNTVTFQSQSLDSSKVELDTTWGSTTYNADGFALSLNHCAYITFRLISISNIASNYSIADVVLITGGSHHITLENNRLYSNTSTNRYNQGSVIKDDYGSCDSFLTIRDNSIKGGSTGISLQGSVSESGNKIEHNLIDSFLGIGIYTFIQDGLIIDKNVIKGENSSNYYVLYIGATNINSKGTDSSYIINNFISNNGGDIGLLSFNNNMLNIYGNTITGKYTALNMIDTSLNNIVNLKNNTIVSLNAGAAISANSNILGKSNFNDIFSSGPILGYFNNIACSNLKEWQMNSNLDSKSVSGDPNLASISTGDFHLTTASNILRHRAAALNILTDDIDGQPRPFLPSIGADDVPLDSNDAALFTIDSPATEFCTTIKNIWVTIRNEGANTIKSLTLNWAINGAARSVVSWSGSLNPGSIAKVKLDTVSFISAKLINITVWTTNPNGKTDGYSGNDSSSKSFGSSLSGTFTIGATAADFKSFSEAVDYLRIGGVCGPVIFNVKDGSYKDRLMIKPVYGTSATNTITFQSQSLDSSKVNLYAHNFDSINVASFVINLNGANYFIFRKMTIANTATSGYTNDVLLSNGAAFNLFSSNRISTSIGAAGTAITNYLANNNTFSDNNIQSSQYGVRIINSMNIIISGNKISNSQIGLGCENTDSLIIKYNKFISILNNGIIFNKSFSSTIRRKDTLIIANNFISATNYGIFISSNRGFSLLNNNVYVSSGTAAFFNSNSTGTSGTVLNNIFANYGSSGTALTNSSYSLNSDFNDFYSKSTNLFYNSSNYSTLSSWRTVFGIDSHSVSVIPSFINVLKGDLHIKSNKAIARKGIHLLSEPFDIDGQRRPYTHPDIGADEFSFDSNDIAVTAIPYSPGNNCLDSISSVLIQLSNLGLKSQSGFNVKLKISGPSSASYGLFFAGTLKAMQDTIVNIPLIPALKTTLHGNYSITAYPDLKQDTDRTNDTLTVNHRFRGGLFAGFTNRSPSCAGDITFFYDSSQAQGSGIIKRVWDFGDGINANAIKPIHVFLNPKPYITTLKVTNANGCTDCVSKIIRVDSADAGFKYSIAGNTVSFTANDSTLRSYSWSFGDGHTDSLKNPVHSYSSLNTFRVSLKVITKAGCIGSLDSMISLLSTPVLKKENPALEVNIYPNPFKETTEISYTLPNNSEVNSDVYDLLGRKLVTLVNIAQPAGKYNIKFHAANYPAGLYILRMRVGESIITKEIEVVK